MSMPNFIHVAQDFGVRVHDRVSELMIVHGTVFGRRFGRAKIANSLITLKIN